MRCKSCNIRLVGNWLIKFELIIAIILGLALGVFIAAAPIHLK